MDDTQKARLQDYFNRSVKGLAGQGFQRSENTPKGAGMYRDNQGRACAVGHLISDELARKGDTAELGGYSIQSCGVRMGFAKDDLPFLSRLQSAHDNTAQWGSMQAGLKQLARDYKLTLPPELA